MDKILTTFSLALTVLVLAACSKNDQPSVPESKGAYEHVIIIGVDGAGAFFSNFTTPNTFEITKGGAYTYNSKTSFPTKSAQCWASMLHGVLPPFHRLSNHVIEGRRYSDTQYPSIFRITREAKPNAALASFCDWNPINYGIIEEGLGVKQGTGNDHEVAAKVIDCINTNNPTLLFVQFDEVDEAGHSHGWGSPEFMSQLTVADSLIGQIYDAAINNGMTENTLFIITADHGGIGDDHGGDTYGERYVFLGISGKTVEERSQILDAETRDIPAIAAYALGLEIPDTWTGHVPTGIFPGVKATQRKEAELPESGYRRHVTATTPSVEKIKGILSNHDVMAYLPFDGDASVAFGDKKSSVSGNLTYSDAYFGKGVVLNNGYVTVKDAKFGTNSFSISFWIKTEGTSGDPAIISNKDWGSGGNDGFIIPLWAEDWEIGFSVASKSADIRMDAASVLPHDYKDGWVHFIVTVDREKNKIQYYYDFCTCDDYDILDGLKNSSFDALDLNIGQDGTGHYDSLPAQMDELIITRDILTESDVAALKKFYSE